MTGRPVAHVHQDSENSRPAARAIRKMHGGALIGPTRASRGPRRRTPARIVIERTMAAASRAQSDFRDGGAAAGEGRPLVLLGFERARSPLPAAARFWREVRGPPPSNNAGPSQPRGLCLVLRARSNSENENTSSRTKPMSIRAMKLYFDSRFRVRDSGGAAFEPHGGVPHSLRDLATQRLLLEGRTAARASGPGSFGLTSTWELRPAQRTGLQHTSAHAIPSSTLSRAHEPPGPSVDSARSLPRRRHAGLFEVAFAGLEGLARPQLKYAGLFSG